MGPITADARRKIVELAPAFNAAFSVKFIATERGQCIYHGRGVTLEQIEAWYLERGVDCRIHFEGKTLHYDRAALVTESVPDTA